MGGVHWLAKRHIDVILEALKRYSKLTRQELHIYLFDVRKNVSQLKIFNFIKFAVVTKQ